MLNRLARLVSVSLLLAASADAGIIYVNHAATGANNGTSWANAFTELRAALPTTHPGDQVWVAAGTYRPAPAGGSVYTPFALYAVELYGGFNGTETSLSQRNWRSNITILSGDLNGDDGDGWGGSDNSKTIVKVLSGDCTIDGLTITAANVTLSDPDNYGAVADEDGNVQIRNCVFVRNSGRCISLESIETASDQVYNCLIYGNRSRDGAIKLRGSHSARVVNCTMVGNVIMTGGFNPSVCAGCDVRNSIVWFNDEYALIHLTLSGDGAQYSNIQSGYAGPNIAVDPRFVDYHAGDFRLLPDSPCIDHGSNAAIPAGVTTDLAGRPRRLDHPGVQDFGQGYRPIVDMGAFEFLPDCNGNGQADVEDINQGFAADINGNFLIDQCEPAGMPICIGDGSGSSCPCGNQSLPPSDAGCANSSGRAGLLAALGTSAVSEDTLVLTVGGLGSTAPALYFQGDGLDLVGGVGGLPFGDGLRCVYGTIIRLGVKGSSNGASMFGAGVPGDPLISVRGAIPPWGGTRYYQVWYRDVLPFCTPAGFNTSNALTIVWGA
jgi:hypothetical protein